MWTEVESSDRVVFDVNADAWRAMTATELPRLLDGSSTAIHRGLVRKTARGLQFNVTADVLRPMIDALQRIHMASILRADRRVLALPARPTVQAAVAESFWMLCELLLLQPYFSHACVRCNPGHPNATVQTTMCPKTVFKK
jgi:hypothetical protein